VGLGLEKQRQKPSLLRITVENINEEIERALEKHVPAKIQYDSMLISNTSNDVKLG